MEKAIDLEKIQEAINNGNKLFWNVEDKDGGTFDDNHVIVLRMESKGMRACSTKIWETGSEQIARELNEELIKLGKFDDDYDLVMAVGAYWREKWKQPIG